jgi:hypothetical protein
MFEDKIAMLVRVKSLILTSPANVPTVAAIATKARPARS